MIRQMELIAPLSSIADSANVQGKWLDIRAMNFMAGMSLVLVGTATATSITVTYELGYVPRGNRRKQMVASKTGSVQSYVTDSGDLPAEVIPSSGIAIDDLAAVAIPAALNVHGVLPNENGTNPADAFPPAEYIRFKVANASGAPKVLSLYGIIQLAR